MNKQNFRKQLGDDLQATGWKIFYASSDADVLIAQKAIESASVQDTVLVGDDTDLLVLLLCHSNPTGKGLFFTPASLVVFENLFFIKFIHFFGKSFCFSRSAM